MRINQYIASAGITSRRKADEMIEEGRVRINGAVLMSQGYHVQEGDVVEVDGQKGIIFELLNSNSLSYEMKTYPEKYDDLVEKYIALYMKIHQTEADPDNFRNIKDVYHEGLDFCKDWYTEEEKAYDDLSDILENIRI